MWYFRDLRAAGSVMLCTAVTVAFYTDVVLYVCIGAFEIVPAHCFQFIVPNRTVTVNMALGSTAVLDICVTYPGNEGHTVLTRKIPHTLGRLSTRGFVTRGRAYTPSRASMQPSRRNRSKATLSVVCAPHDGLEETVAGIRPRVCAINLNVEYSIFFIFCSFFTRYGSSWGVITRRGDSSTNTFCRSQNEPTRGYQIQQLLSGEVPAPHQP